MHCSLSAMLLRIVRSAAYQAQHSFVRALKKDSWKQVHTPCRSLLPSPHHTQRVTTHLVSMVAKLLRGGHSWSRKADSPGPDRKVAPLKGSPMTERLPVRAQEGMSCQACQLVLGNVLELKEETTAHLIALMTASLMQDMQILVLSILTMQCTGLGTLQ